MGSSFLSPPAKRTFHYTLTGMSEHNPYTSTINAAANESSNKRSKPPPPPLAVPPGHASFRLLCHSSRIGGVIGKSGNIIKQIQQQTGAKIRVEEPPVECPDRVITVIGQNAVVSRISISEEEIEVSKGQEALVRVFGRILDVAAETDGTGVVAGGMVSCRLLTEASQVGSVIGKGGKIVEKMRKDFGVKIRALTDKLPVCAESTEEMIEIEGDVIAVKKALVAVSRCLQDSQPVDKTRMTDNKLSEAIPKESLPDVHNEFLSQHKTVIPTFSSSSAAYTPRFHSFPLESDGVPIVDAKVQQDVVFRILCSNDRVGGIIGKGGTIIKSLQNETGATISVGATVAECNERLITITASENSESRYSAAQRTTVLVYSRSVEAGYEKGLDSAAIKGSQVTARLVIPSKQVGCLLGKGGSIISEMRKLTGTSIKILGADQAPKCVSQDDQVVQISGDLMHVKDAIYHVTGRLRDNLFSNKRSMHSTGTKGTSSVLTETSAYGGLRDPLRDVARDPLRNVMRDPLRDTLRDVVRDPLRDVTRDPLRDPLRIEVRDPLRDRMRDPLIDSLRDTARDPLTARFMDSLRESLGGPSSLSLHSSLSAAQSLGQHTTFTKMDHFGPALNFDRPASPTLWTGQTTTGVNLRSKNDSSRGFACFKGSLELGSGSKSAVVTNTTVEIAVPENVIGSVYGENGGNLARLRQISGAKVIVHEPRIGTSDRIIVISGTPDQTQAAQSLLQAFILTG
ncbi:hypothetical protein K2173_009196 [Erythroxylum novogranatense]|uniref:K Homology domain-containing protein n=1 Tax=Erythroxylum novogranatense TaxID=1862640 RepID=A0AAV8TEE5_9ROSI|nr:hypothetical protein K2173_009196 [Erythroxylum novogranatense]